MESQVSLQEEGRGRLDTGREGGTDWRDALEAKDTSNRQKLGCSRNPGAWPCPHLRFGPVILIMDCKRRHFCCIEAPGLW